MIKVIINGKESREYSESTTFYEISKDCKLKYHILGVKINNEVVSLNNIARDGQELEFFDITDIYGARMYKSGLKMIFEVALQRLYPECDVSYDHSISSGMLGTVKGDVDLNASDVLKIRDMMNRIVNDNIVFKKLNVRKKEAIEYYEKVKQYEKAQNIRNLSDKTITLYQLENLLNYYYSDMPYSTSSVDRFELIYLGNNRIIFMWPSRRHNGEIPEYVHLQNVIDSFSNGKNWLTSLKMPYVGDLNNVIGNAKIKEFINSSEIVFNLKISKIAELLVKDSSKKFVLIAGPSSSGKTTSCKRLAEYLSALGYDPIKISTDDYFVGKSKTPKDENGEYDFECLEAIDVAQLNKDVLRLLNHEKVVLPEYDFITGERVNSNKVAELKENSIILIEGLHCLNDALLPEVDSSLKYKIYLSPFIPLNIDRHNYISTVDLRLIRRIVRDNRDRGALVSATMQSWQKVRNGEEKYIFPFIKTADMILNTALPYELGVLKVYVEPLLHSVGLDSPYYEESKRLLNSLKQFFPIPGDYVNSTSILREFIGGRENV